MSSTAVFEHSYYIGNYMSAILYGIELVMYFATLKAYSVQKARRQQGNAFLVLYCTALWVLVTIDISCNAVWGEQLWITSRTNGGPEHFLATEVTVWYQLLGSVTGVALILLGDALVVYRCYVLWNSDWKIIFIPVIVYLAAMAMSIIELVGGFTPGGNFFAGRAVTFGTSYYSLSISLNAILTLLICGRLIYLSRLMRSALGEESARIYTGIAVLMAESAAPYTILGIMFLVPYARGSPTAISFGQVYAKLACLSPQLIALRVMQGRAWSKETVNNAQQSSLSFNSRTRLQHTLSSLPADTTQLSELNSKSNGLTADKESARSEV